MYNHWQINSISMGDVLKYVNVSRTEAQFVLRDVKIQLSRSSDD